MSKAIRRRAQRVPALTEESYEYEAMQRQVERKVRQLCRQVQEAVGAALGSLDDDLLNAAWVAGVEPEPDASRLVVFIEVDGDTPSERVFARLERVAGWVRGEVAQAITRKRTPALAFRVLLRESSQ
ncbi:MAG: ribosome-binding factor A [Polyangiaceae bacterium]